MFTNLYLKLKQHYLYIDLGNFHSAGSHLHLGMAGWKDTKSVAHLLLALA